MAHLRIPKHWTNQRSTPFFTKDNIPAALLSHHNTAEGVFGQICVMEGTVTFYGFADAEATEPEAASDRRNCRGEVLQCRTRRASSGDDLSPRMWLKTDHHMRCNLPKHLKLKNSLQARWMCSFMALYLAPTALST